MSRIARTGFMKGGLSFLRAGYSRYPGLLHALCAAALYGLAASVSLPLAVPGGIISPLWPPAAVAVIVCLRWGSRMATAIWLGATLVFLLRGWAPLPAAVTGAAAGLAAWSAAMLIERLQRRGGDFIYNGNLFRFLLIALASGLLSAPLAMGGAMLGGRLGPQPWLGWLTWSLGTATGTVIFTPLLRAWPFRPGLELTREEKLEAFVFTLLLLTITYLAFSGASEVWSFSYLPLPFMIWAAYRFSVPAIAWSTAVVCLVATLGTLRGTGPFSHADLNTALLMLAVYVSAIGVIGLTLSSLIHQRARVQRTLQDERDNLELRVLARTQALDTELQERKRVERQLAEAQRVAQVGSWNWDLEEREIVWSEQLYRIYGVEPGHSPTLPRRYLKLVHPDDRAALVSAFKRCRQSGAPFTIEHRVQLEGDGERIVAAKGQGERAADGKVRRIYGTAQDITEARRAEAALQEARERYRLVVEISPDAILVEQDERIVFANPAAAELLSAPTVDEIAGQRFSQFLSEHSFLHARQLPAHAHPGQGVKPIECRLRRVDGMEVDIELSSSPFSHLGRFALLHVMRDITERKRSAEQMAYLAHYDSLTGLANRALFNQRLEHALSIAARPGRTLELLFLDLDRFKEINDTLGHETGDLVLQETAKRLRESLRESDTVARLAGDEFVVLSENVEEPQRGGTIAEKILRAFALPYLVDATSLHISTSIGIAVYPNDGDDAATLLKRADMAMYRAKQQGRNRYCYYSPTLNIQTAERRNLEQALRNAIERNELTLHYQPRIDMASGRPTGMEALLRWNCPDLGSIAPAQFIPIADKAGLIIAIGHWALRQACQQARHWQDAGAADLKIAVNLSARQLTDAGLVDNIQTILKETGLTAHTLEIEITEDALTAKPDKALQVLKVLRRLGISVTIDDFGIGYSSLSRLKHFPIAAVKIDRSLVHGLPLDHDNAAVTRGIIRLGHSLECTVAAQGAETQQEVDFLREHACNSVQGFYFSEPMPAEYFGDLNKLWRGPETLLH